MEQDVKKKHLEDRASFTFIPYVHLKDRMNEVDIAMLCPHLQMYAKRDADLYTIPITIIPPKLYGLMDAEDFIDDAEDLCQLWQNGARNILHFEDEPSPLAVKRSVSHRRWLKGEKFGDNTK